jgi:Secreted protein containing C-terminal beta-propeller domain distantly related to WD-40 repeats
VNASPSPSIARPVPHRRSPSWRSLAAGFALASLAATGAAACTSDEPAQLGPYRLVFFDSCTQALADLRAATKEVVGPYGLPGAWDLVLVDAPPVLVTEDRAAMEGVAAAGEAPQLPVPQPAAEKAPDHSGTNVHEAGVDEPDLVKTDGRRIVTVSNGRLSVVDVASRRLVGVVDLLDSDVGYDANLLLAGDHALVLSNHGTYPPVVLDLPAPRPMAEPVPGVAEPVPDLPLNPPVDEPLGELPVPTASIVLVDLTTPRVLSRARADGSIVDARQVGSTVRVVTRSAPRLDFRASQGSDEERLAANRAVIDASDIDAWSPRLEVTTGSETVRTQVPCEAISRPTHYSGANLLTVLTFDASRDSLGDGSPVTIAADGDTVYSKETSLYVASNQAWMRAVPTLAARTPAQPQTEIYRFDTTTTPPRFVAGGSVPGHLLNQYSMSEWDGRLRVATTVEAMDTGSGFTESHSGVYVLEMKGDRLVQVGAIDGLGKGERIYAVRFLGPVGYVVTFRQTDPLYTVDLRNPTAPVVRGELKIPGYSAYLHPLDDTRLIGIGQDATDSGQTLGTQVSLFDVGNLDAPARIAQYTLDGGFSEAEFDPHAFLYWPADGLLVVPMQSRYGFGERIPFQEAPDQMFGPGMSAGAIVLRITGDTIVEIGYIGHPTTEYRYQPPIRRSLVTTAGGGTTLWTVSEGGLMATDPATLARLAWIPW